MAGSTLVVSLPAKWARRYNVIKGQEIELTENGSTVNISAGGEPELKRAEFDAKGLDKRIVRLYLGGLHKIGYDEIEVIYDDPKIIEQIQDLIKNYFVGFVIINQTKTRCTIKSISKDSQEEFNSTLRRAFLVTKNMGEIILESLKTKDRQSLKNSLDLEKTNNKLTGFCHRSLNRWGHKSSEKTAFYYVIAWNLEKICDDYKYICENVLNQKEISVSKYTIDYFERCLSLFGDYYSVFYKYDPKEISKVSIKGKELIKIGEDLIGETTKSERMIVCTLISQVNKILDFISSTIPIFY